MTDGVLTSIGWERLRDEGRDASSDLGIPSLELDAATQAGPVRIAIGPDGEPRLLLPLRAGDPFPSLTETRGIDLKDRVLLLRGRLTRFAQLSSRDRELDPVFEKLTGDVVRRLNSGIEAAAAVEDAVADFRALLLAGKNRVTSERAAGLLGELIVLNHLLEADDGAWKRWTGPLGARHDFRFGNDAIEVKTSLRAQRRSIEISALDQLSAPEDGKLTLAHLILEYDAGGHFSVPDEAQRALGRANDPQELADRLAAAGYISELKDRWSAFRFAVLSSDYYRVVDGFPRLTPASFSESGLPAGVSHFRYQVDLSTAVEFRMGPEDVRNLLGQAS